MSKHADKRTNVYLIGFSGCGKSSVGPILAAGISAEFFDTDDIIRRNTRMNIADIFAQRGEAGFRKLEEKVVKKLVRSRRRPRVVALGGGAFQNPRIRRMAAADGTTVYLSCSARELYRRSKSLADRPLLAGMSGITLYNRINALLARRLHNYKKAEIVVSTTARLPRQTAAELRKKIAERYG